jgi:hypothetical protein
MKQIFQNLGNGETRVASIARMQPKSGTANSPA